MLSKVMIHSNLTAEACEAAINQAIEDYAGYDVTYDILVEGSVAFAGRMTTTYSLIINIENMEN